MKKFIFVCLLGLICCGPNRSFEGKNIYGSTSAQSSSSSGTGGSDQPKWSQSDPGTRLGQTLPIGLSWKGFDEGKNISDPVDLNPEDWYDPDGSIGINAVMVITAKHNCKPCEDEAAMIENKMATWNSLNKGIKVVTLLVDSKTGDVPLIGDAYSWKVDYLQVDAAVGIDPERTFIPDPIFGWPYHTIIDPTQMRVVGTQEGIIDNYSIIEGLAAANKQH